MQVDFEFRARKGVTRTKRRREARSDGLKAYVEDGSSEEKNGEGKSGRERWLPEG
jgi:hypothetical protein